MSFYLKHRERCLHSGRTARHRLNRGGSRRAIGLFTASRSAGYAATRGPRGTSRGACPGQVQTRGDEVPWALHSQGGPQGAARTDRQEAWRRYPAGRKAKPSRHPPAGGRRGLGIRVETMSAIETERAKYFEAGDAYEALLGRWETSGISD